MIKIKKILCPIDFSKCSDNALQNALELAERYKAELHLFHAIIMFEHETYYPDDRVPDFNESYNILTELTNTKLANLVKENKISIKKVHTRGFSAAEEILSYATSQDMDLIVVGTHGRKAISHFLLGSVAEKVVRLAPCPVLIIHEQSRTIGTHKNILVPIDFSEHSQKALSCALEMASKYDSKITLFHAIEQQVHPAFYASGKSSIFEIDAQLKERSLSAMKKFRENLNYPKVSTMYKIVEGNASHEIIEYAKENDVDLLVIATHGLTGLEHFLMGSTTEKVIRRVNVPVYVVKTLKRTSYL